MSNITSSVSTTVLAGRGGPPAHDAGELFSRAEVEESARSCGNPPPWVCDVVTEAIDGVGIGRDDANKPVSAGDLVCSMMFRAYEAGRSARDPDPVWGDPCFENFVRHSKVYELKDSRLDDLFTEGGRNKLRTARINIRARLEERHRSRGRERAVDPMVLASFPPGRAPGEAGEMGKVYLSSFNDPGLFVRFLQGMGNHEESDPRYYLHVVYRYHMHGLHDHLADIGIVVSWPSLQAWMDLRSPVSFQKIPPQDLKEFMDAKGGEFETDPWVRALRREIGGAFSEWKRDPPSPGVLMALYPRALMTSTALPDGRIAAVRRAFSRALDMKELRADIDSHTRNAKIDVPALQDAVREVPQAATISVDYKNAFEGACPGRQAERRGFFLDPEVRTVLQGISKAVEGREPGLWKATLDALAIRHGARPGLFDYCKTRKAMPRLAGGDDKAWEDIIQALVRICRALHVLSRIEEVNDFYRENGSENGYLRRELEKELEEPESHYEKK